MDPFSPEWWLARLEKLLDAQVKRIKPFDDYYEGNHDLRFASVQFTTAFGQMFLGSADNWMPLVVSSVQERLGIEGFRLGQNTAGDRRAWRIWQANNLDADSAMLFREALINGIAYTLTWPDENDPSTPLITVEHPSQAIVATSPSNRRVRLAGLKRWVEDDGSTSATLYLPDFIYKFTKGKRGVGGGGWQIREEAGEEWPLPNGFGAVPLVPIVSQQRMLKTGGASRVGPFIASQDKINKLTFDMMIASEYAAFRQRWASGVSIPVDPVTKQPVEAWKHAVNRVWTSSDPAAKFGDFSETDLGNYVKAIELQVQSLASRSRTPAHYMLGSSGSFPSGESLRATETGLIQVAGDYQLGFGEGLEETLRLGLAAIGVRARGAASMETVWRDAETKTESEHVDSILKQLALGVPLRQLWVELGYSESQIERFSAMLVEEAQIRSSLRDAGRDGQSSEADAATGDL